MQQYRCPNCGSAISRGVKFCSNCGSKLSWVEQPATTSQYVCPACNSPVAVNAKFCNNCGSPLSWQTQAQSQPPPIKPEHRRTGISESGGNKALRNTGIIILSLILFLSLVLFAPAFMVDRTVLNPDFIASEVDRLDVTSLIADTIDELPPEELPAEISGALTVTLNKLEPMLKQEFNSAVRSIYDYIKGKKDNPELAGILRSTFLSNKFLYSMIDEVDIAEVISPFLPQILSGFIPEELSDISTYLYPAAEDFLAKEEIWIKDQFKTLAEPVADYLVGDIKSFSVDISLEPVQDSLKETISEHIEPVISDLGILGTLLPQEFIDDMIDQFLENIPLTFEIRDTMIGAHIPAEIASTIGEIESTLSEIKGYVGNFQTGYIVLIVLLILLTAGIILIYRQVKGATRTLGIVFLIAGVIDLVAILLVKGAVSEQIKQAITDLPSQLQLWLLQFVNNVTTPMLIISICFIVGGILLIITSLVWRPREAI